MGVESMFGKKSESLVSDRIDAMLSGIKVPRDTARLTLWLTYKKGRSKRDHSWTKARQLHVTSV